MAGIQDCSPMAGCGANGEIWVVWNLVRLVVCPVVQSMHRLNTEC
jgi:hypothetical protein